MYSRLSTIALTAALGCSAKARDFAPNAGQDLTPAVSAQHGADASSLDAASPGASAPESPQPAADGATTEATEPDGGAALPTDAGGALQAFDAEPQTSADGAAEVPMQTPDQLTDGLVLLLSFEDAATTRILRDSSGLANDGVADGAIGVTTGPVGSAASFDGASRVVVANAPSLTPSRQLTLSAWVYPTEFDTADSYGIISKRLAYDEETSYTLWLTQSGAVSCDLTTTNDRFATEDALPLSTWTHLAVVFDGYQPSEERVRVYANGRLIKIAAESSTEIPASFAADVMIGDLPNGGHPFVGAIDEAAIWTRALSESEVQTVAAATTPIAAH